jgi:hypothetical protein
VKNEGENIEQFYKQLNQRLHALEFCRNIPYVVVIEKDLAGSVQMARNYFRDITYSDWFIFKENYTPYDVGGVRKSFKSCDYPERTRRYMDKGRLRFDVNLFTLTLGCEMEHLTNTDKTKLACPNNADSNNAIDYLRLEAQNYGWDDKHHRYTGKWNGNQDDVIVTLQMLIYWLDEIDESLDPEPRRQLTDIIRDHHARGGSGGYSF